MNKPRLNEDSKRVFTKYTGSIKPKIEAARRELDEFEQKARKFGYIRLAPDEVVIKRATAELALITVKNCGDFGTCEGCNFAVADLESALNREVTP